MRRSGERFGVRRVVWVAGVCALWLSACERGPVGPEQAYRDFHAAVVDREWDTAIAAFGPRSRQAFESIGRRLVELGGLKEQPLDVFLRAITARPVVPLRSVEPEKSDSAGVVLKVTAGDCRTEGAECRVSRVRMVRRDGRWLVEPELPPLLVPPATAEMGPGS